MISNSMFMFHEGDWGPVPVERGGSAGGGAGGRLRNSGGTYLIEVGKRRRFYCAAASFGTDDGQGR